MFTEKRRKNYMTFIYTAIIIVLCLLIAAIAWPSEPGTAPVNNTGSTDADNLIKDNNSDHGGILPEDNAPEEKNDISKEAGTYYLVKNVDGQIKVFFMDEGEDPVELETTEIIYDLLSTADQKLFDEGFKVKNQEELAVLLQDFES